MEFLAYFYTINNSRGRHLFIFLVPIYRYLLLINRYFMMPTDSLNSHPCFTVKDRKDHVSSVCAVQCSKVYSSKVQCSKVYSSKVHCSKVQCSKVYCSVVQCSKVLCSKVQRTKVQFSSL